MNKSEKYKEVEINPNNEEDKKPRKKASNKIKIIEEWLSDVYDFRFNTVTKKPEYSTKGVGEWKTMDDEVLSSLWRNLQHDGHNASLSYIDSVIKSDFSPRINPILQYFSTVHWDGKDYIKTLASTIKLSNYENERWVFFFRKWLVGMVANIFEEHRCANHICLILAGTQGKGKSTWLSRLLPSELFDYYYEGKIDPEHKDSLFLTASNILVNVDDYFDNVNRKKADTLKGFITEPFVKCRRPYGRYEVTLPKIASFAGTSNDDAFLYDSSGSRRFLAAMITDIDQQGSNGVDRSQVFAQAYELYQLAKKGEFVYWLLPEEQKEMEKVNEQFQVDSQEYELICKYVRRVEKNSKGMIEYLTNSDLKVRLEVFSNGKLSSRKIGQALKKLGFARGCFDKAQRGVKVYKMIWLGEPLKDSIGMTLQDEDKKQKEWKQGEIQLPHPAKMPSDVDLK